MQTFPYLQTTNKLVMKNSKQQKQRKTFKIKFLNEAMPKINKKDPLSLSSCISPPLHHHPRPH